MLMQKLILLRMLNHGRIQKAIFKKYSLGGGSISVFSSRKLTQLYAYAMATLYILHFNAFNFIEKV